MKNCYICNINNSNTFSVRNKGTICSKCKNNQDVRFEKCKHCQKLIDTFDDYIVYSQKYNCDLCEDCYFDLYKIHSWEYKPNTEFIHNKNQYRKTSLHIGTELELVAKDKNKWLNDFANNSLNKMFYLKNDTSIGEDGVEIVSQPMTIDKLIIYYKHLFKLINKHNLTVNDNCGLHFHLDKEYLDYNIIRNIDYIINNHTNYFSKIVGRDYSNNDYCSKANKQIYNWGNDLYGKYTAVNLNSEKTVEIRVFAATNEYEDFINKIKIVFALVEYCKEYTFDHINSMNVKDFQKEFETFKSTLDF